MTSPATFASDIQRRCHETVGPMLKSLLEDAVQAREGTATFLVVSGQAVAAVSVGAWGDDEATITTRGYVSLGPRREPELLEFLLRENDRALFGAFGVDADGDVFFEHTVLGLASDGHHVTKRELAVNVLAVLAKVESVQGEVLERWGGRRPQD